MRYISEKLVYIRPVKSHGWIVMHNGCCREGQQGLQNNKVIDEYGGDILLSFRVERGVYKAVILTVKETWSLLHYIPK